MNIVNSYRNPEYKYEWIEEGMQLKVVGITNLGTGLELKEYIDKIVIVTSIHNERSIQNCDGCYARYHCFEIESIEKIVSKRTNITWSCYLIFETLDGRRVV